jgi:hypothetical protein
MGKVCSIAACGRKFYARDFCHMHYQRWKNHGNALTMKRAPSGTGSINAQGYRVFHRPNGESGREHVIVAERAIGHRLPKGAIVHHVNGIRTDNRNSNLVVCPNDSYHQLLHVRQRALAACGNANFRKCDYCPKYDDPSIMKSHGNRYFHPECRANVFRINRIRRESASAPVPCQICGREFRPKKATTKLCGDADCRRKCGELSARKLWAANPC